MLKKRPPQKASAGACGTPNRLGSSVCARTAGCTALASATSGREPRPACRLGEERGRERDRQAGKARPEHDGDGQPPEGGSARRRGQAQGHAEEDGLDDELDGERREGQGQDGRRGRDRAAAVASGPSQQAGDEGRERQGLQEDVEVQAGQGEARERVHRAGEEGTRTARSPARAPASRRRARRAAGAGSGATRRRPGSATGRGAGRAGRGRGAGRTLRRGRGSRAGSGLRGSPGPRRAAGEGTSP